LPNNGTFPTIPIKCDPSKTVAQLGIDPKSFEKMVVDLVGQYVELVEKENAEKA
jgi:hypothetical protein